MKNKVVPLRLSENLLELVALYSEEQRTDKSTTLRQWLYRSAEEYVARLVGEGRISSSKAAELLEVSVFDIYRIAEQYGIESGATKDQYEQSRQNAVKLQE
jgi:hypothetical protein